VGVFPYFGIWIIGPNTEIIFKLDFSAENATAFGVKSLHASERLEWVENRSILSSFLWISELISVFRYLDHGSKYRNKF
jgi:hypothetical protein